MRPIRRRQFLQSSLLVAAGALANQWSFGAAPFVQTRASARPPITHGIASGDVEEHRAVLWARADRPAQLIAELSSRSDFKQAQQIRGTVAGLKSDFSAHVYPDLLDAGTEYRYRSRFESLEFHGMLGEPVEGRFETAPDRAQDIRFCWSGDTAGQGFGLSESEGGMLTYASMAQRDPDFFVHCWDLIYADNPMQFEMEPRDGKVWKNHIIEAKTKGGRDS